MQKIEVKGKTVQPGECKQTNKQTDATKCIISLLIKIIFGKLEMLELHFVSEYSTLHSESRLMETWFFYFYHNVPIACDRKLHIHLRAFATNTKNVKCSPLPEFNIIVQGDWVWWTVLKFDVDSKSTD